MKNFKEIPDYRSSTHPLGGDILGLEKGDIATVD